MTTTCQVCHAPDLEWSANPGRDGRYHLHNVNTGQEHVCRIVSKPNAIPRFETVAGIVFDRKAESLAHAQTQEAVRCGLDPFKTKPEVRETHIILH
jgi:hypothetical protein